MDYFSSSPLADISEIRSNLTKRRKPYIEKTVSAANKELLAQKVEIAEQEGWRILRKNKESVRMALDKTLPEVHEDEIWCLMAAMGFKEFSLDRNFKINYKDGFSKQIDVFCKDDDTAFVIECTQCEKYKAKRLNDKLSEFSDIKVSLFDAVKSYYDNRNIKVKLVLATKNIQWSDKDIQKANEENIFVLRDEEFNYFTELTKRVKFAAKYQFLAKAFQGQKINNINLSVPATRGKMGKTVFYNFLIKPSDLMKISYVSHQSSLTMDDLDTYQRMLKAPRLKGIGKYIDNGGQFPTNIVINIKTKKKLKFDEIEKLGSSSYGKLQLPSKFATAWIIDGQHRLYGYTFSERFQNLQEDTSSVPVLAYENLPASKETQLFVDINCEQQKVQSNLLSELVAALHWDSEDFKQRTMALCARLIMKMGADLTSPFSERIITTDKKKTKYRTLTLKNFLDGLLENKMFGEEKANGFIPGYLTATYSNNKYDTLLKAKDILEGFFSPFSTRCNENWELGLEEGGFICTNIAIRSLIIVLKELFAHIEATEQVAIADLKGDDVVELLGDYIDPLVDFVNELDIMQANILRGRSSKKGVSDNAMHLMHQIHKAKADFFPKSLEKYLETVDIDGTKEAVDLINDIQRTLFNFTISSLKKKYPEKEEWWFKGIPSTVRKNCSDRHESEDGIKAKEQYLTLINYRSIALDNWDIMEKAYSFTVKGNKTKKTKWLVDLNEIRNITHHAEKWPASKDQIKFVREVHRFVMEAMV